MEPSRLTHRVLVTGGTGFVGSALVALLKAQEPDCVILAIGRGQGEPDIRDAGAISDLVRDFQPTAVVHLAAIAAPGEASASPRLAWDVNLTGTMNLAEAVRRHTPAARFVFSGSSECYGRSFNLIDGPISECAALRPQNVYAATKAAAELMLGQMSRDGLKAIRFRPFNHTGPGQTDTYVVPSFARQVAEVANGRRAPVIEVGNLDAQRDFMDVRDVVRAYAIAALGPELPQGSERVFNLASGKPLKIGAVLEKLVAMSGKKVEIRIDPDRLRPNDVPIACGDASAALAELGWKPEIAFERTLSETFEFWRSRSV